MRSITTILFILLLNRAVAFDHSHKLFNDILNKYTKAQNSQTLVNYSLLKQNPKKLISYLTALSNVKKSDFKKNSKNKQLAFLINAYNAFTIKLIIDNYPLKSIRDIGSFFKSAWKIRFFSLFEEEMHLDHLEHVLIRKNYNEPKIHFAVNCASISCPSLLREAFTGATLKTQLEKSANLFLKDRNKNYYDQNSKTLYISKIFKWYGDDFKRQGKNKINFIQNYIKIVNSEKINLNYLDYNWSLNEFK